ncbi:MAG: adenine methyltransferase [SAR86 cluster bacterium]|uniref:Adenine methyltransferase n=1 Tax=SAR86 cluster bacterium TaxID=2030880 RepID=A0A2A5AHF4_9GAMM|nr:MAG: adenine methyltransferase [SAR86 cluster bacterium]
MPRLTRPIKVHGGKFYLSKWIIAHMPAHTHYVEPYCGGLLLLDKDPTDKSEVVNDIDGLLTNFWHVIGHPHRFAAFRRRVEGIAFSQRAFVAAKRYCSGVRDGTTQVDSVVEAAVRFFVMARMSRQGLQKDFATLTRRRLRRGMNEQAASWLGSVEGLTDVHARLRSVVVLNQEATAVIESQDGPDTLHYLDPPYLHETRAVTDAYANEMDHKAHARLLHTLYDVEGKFILSGYDSPLYRAAAKANGWRVRKINIDNKAGSGESKRVMTECIWMNFKPPTPSVIDKRMKLHDWDAIGQPPKRKGGAA